MGDEPIYGYAGHLLRIDLGREKFERIPLSPDFAANFIGGSGFGAKFLYQEVLPGTQWSDPENKVILSTGPLGGSRVSGAGTFSMVAKGPMTDHGGTSQANGFFGAYLKLAGFDGLIIQGKAKRPCGLIIREGKVEFFDARHLWGLDTWETEKRVRKEGNYGRSISVYSVGPAAEKGVRFSVLCGDQGHIASKNGMGAVLAAKNLKALGAVRGSHRIPVHDEALLKKLAEQLLEKARTYRGGSIHQWGTAGIVGNLHLAGVLPVKNYTTNLFPAYERVNGQTIRKTMQLKPKPCWRCGIRHLHFVKVLDGPYAGTTGEEPELECVTAFGPLIGQENLGAIVMLSDLVDRLGLDANETGWTVAWVMECYQRGILTKNDLDGLEMNWGNVEAARSLIQKIARREGIGDILAEGVMRAAGKIGGQARDCAIFTQKGATPRGHDHRGRWSEMLDTCLSTTSTLEATGGGGPRPELYGFPPVKDPFDPLETGAANALVNGYKVFEDSLGICNFNAVDPRLTLECVNAVTNWNLDLPGAMRTGLKTIHRLRMFNLRHGQDIRLEAPSSRYGSTPSDGPCQGRGISPHWEKIRERYYEGMGWDKQTGWPLAETLRKLGLDDLVSDLPGER
jgi:aldehyde:ferredoxin oxidoreductase